MRRRRSTGFLKSLGIGQQDTLTSFRFVEGNITSGLDLGCGGILIQGSPASAGESKEDTVAGYIVELGGLSCTGRECHNRATKNTKVIQIRGLAGLKFNG